MLKSGEEMIGEHFLALAGAVAGADDRKFISAEANQEGVRRQCLAQPVSSRGQRRIAEIVAEGIVDVLEAVEIEGEQQDVETRGRGVRDCFAQAGVKQHPIWQAGQPIMLGDVPALALAVAGDALGAPRIERFFHQQDDEHRGNAAERQQHPAVRPDQPADIGEIAVLQIAAHGCNIDHQLAQADERCGERGFDLAQCREVPGKPGAAGQQTVDAIERGADGGSGTVHVNEQAELFVLLAAMQQRQRCPHGVQLRRYKGPWCLCIAGDVPGQAGAELLQFVLKLLNGPGIDADVAAHSVGAILQDCAELESGGRAEKKEGCQQAMPEQPCCMTGGTVRPRVGRSRATGGQWRKAVEPGHSHVQSCAPSLVQQDHAALIWPRQTGTALRIRQVDRHTARLVELERTGDEDGAGPGGGDEVDVGGIELAAWHIDYAMQVRARIPSPKMDVPRRTILKE